MSDAGRAFLAGAAGGAVLAMAALVGVLLRSGPGERGAAEPAAGARFSLPVEGVRVADLSGRFDERRGERLHGAIDIPAPRGTPVRAVAAGVVSRLARGEQAGLSVDQVASDGHHCFFYAHLDRWAAGLKEGVRVEQGALLGYVGTTGNASEDGPHLHFAVHTLEPGQGCWEGEPVDPVAFLGERGRIPN